MTTLEKITSLNWFDFLVKIKNILQDLYTQSKDINPEIIITNESTLNFKPVKKYIFITYTGTTNITTLPSIESSIGITVIMTNGGTGDVTLNSLKGQSDIWDGGTLTNSKVIGAGVIIRLTNDGESFKTQ